MLCGYNDLMIFGSIPKRSNMHVGKRAFGGMQ